MNVDADVKNTSARQQYENRHKWCGSLHCHRAARQTSHDHVSFHNHVHVWTQQPMWAIAVSLAHTHAHTHTHTHTHTHKCCVRVGSRWFPSTQPLPCAAPRYEAALARPDCRSGVKLKRTLQTFIGSLLSQAVALDRRRVSWAQL